MQLTSGYENRKARIEMVPLIDIAFLLLVFFIYAMLSMTVYKGFKVELPEASAARIDKIEHISITITKDNEIYLDKEQVTLNSLLDGISECMGRKDDIQVAISGDIHADLGVAISVLDLLRRSGIKDISFECRDATK
ncbi:MAG: biopolymer transporter ExbD [Thermodesulfobacteriota bacterium]|nr:biopolymer transporter ExbD [Thermodesulfobacteriota bacterium]